MDEQGWKPEQETISGAEPGWAGQRLDSLAVVRPRRRFGRGAGSGTRATALGTAVALVLLGGVATAAYRGSQGATDPTTLIPSSAFAVAVADLGMPGGQGDALKTLADRFPGSPTRTGDGSAVDRLLRAMFRDGSPAVDYDKQIRPWLGDHVAIAGWLDDGKPTMEVLVETTAESAARDSIADLMKDDPNAAASLEFRSGYAVLSNSHGDTVAALDAAKSSSLASSGGYAADIARLPADEAAVGWMDGPGVGKALGSALGDLGMSPDQMFGAMPFGAMWGGNALSGRAVVGVHLTDDYVQLDVVQTGGTATSSTAPSSMLTSLPDATVAGVEIADAGNVATQLTSMLRTLGGFGAATGATVCSAPPMPVPGAIQIPKGTPHRRQILRQIRKERHRLRHLRRHQQGGSCTFTPPPAPVDPLTEIADATGLQLPGDAQTLLGDRAVLAYGGLEVAGLPDLAIRSHPADLDAAQQVAERLRTHLADVTDLGVRTADADLVLATSGAYADAIAAGGSLGTQPQARTALGDVPDTVAAAAYLDLSRLWPLMGPDVPDAVKHLKAVGMWATTDGGTQHLQARLVIG